jgi:outer membrane murein-binding lipoprotein Lpp
MLAIRGELLSPDLRAVGSRSGHGYAVPVRRLLFVALSVLAVALVAGCGSSTKTAGSSPEAQTLSYFPASSPFVLTFATDPKSAGIKNARAVQQRFPQAAVLESALFARLGQLGIDYNMQIKPLYGNPIAVGLLSARSYGSQTPFLSAWVTRDQSALNALVKKLGSGLRSSGTHDGAKLYTLSGWTLAIDGPTLLIARSSQDVAAALDRHKAAQGISAAQYATLTAGLPSGALMHVFGDLTQALSTAKTAPARKIPWVAAIKGYGASVDVSARGLMIQFHIDTTGRSLASSQLPLAGGSTPASVAGSAPIQVGLGNLTQPIRFIEAAVQVSAPDQYSTFNAHVSRLKRRTGFDLNAFIAMLTGNLAVSSDTRATIARVGVGNPSAVKGMINRLAGAPSLAFSKGTKVQPLGGGLYSIRETSGTDLTMGVVGNQLLLGKATPAQIRSFAQAPSASVPGTAGALSFRIALLDLLHLTLKQAPSPAAQQFLKLLGDLKGSASATSSGLNGTAKLALR